MWYLKWPICVVKTIMRHKWQKYVLESGPLFNRGLRNFTCWTSTSGKCLRSFNCGISACENCPEKVYLWNFCLWKLLWGETWFVWLQPCGNCPENLYLWDFSLCEVPKKIYLWSFYLWELPFGKLCLWIFYIWVLRRNVTCGISACGNCPENFYI